MKAVSSDLRKFLHEVREMGWDAGHTSGGHIRLTHPRCGMVIMSSTTASWRYIQNARSHIARKMREIGADLKGEPNE